MSRRGCCLHRCVLFNVKLYTSGFCNFPYECYTAEIFKSATKPINQFILQSSCLSSPLIMALKVSGGQVPHSPSTSPPPPFHPATLLPRALCFCCSLCQENPTLDNSLSFCSSSLPWNMLPEARGLLNQAWVSGALLLQACLLISEINGC